MRTYTTLQHTATLQQITQHCNTLQRIIVLSLTKNVQLRNSDRYDRVTPETRTERKEMGKKDWRLKLAGETCESMRDSFKMWSSDAKNKNGGKRNVKIKLENKRCGENLSDDWLSSHKQELKRKGTRRKGKRKGKGNVRGKMVFNPIIKLKKWTIREGKRTGTDGVQSDNWIKKVDNKRGETYGKRWCSIW